MLLMCAIITDTMTLKSVTTTDTDRETLAKLELITGISAAKMGQEIFASAKGFVGDITKIIRTDYKIFEARQGRYGVSQVEVSNIDLIDDPTLDNIYESLAKIKE